MTAVATLPTSETADYLGRLFAGCDGGYSVSWLPASGPMESFYSSTLDGLIHRVRLAERERPSGIYVRMTTLAGPPARGKRGSAEDSQELVCLWADIDFDTVGHKHDPDRHGGLVLPPDEEAAISIIALAGLPEPSMVVHSGGGLYPLWLFEKPWDLRTSPDALATAADLSARWNRQLADGAARSGWFYGTGMGDLSRVLRLPGTINRKAGAERPCRVLSDDGPTYTPDELFTALEDAELLYGGSHTTPTATAVTTQEQEELDFRDATEPGVFQRLHSKVGIAGVLLADGWSECGCGRRDVEQCFTRPGAPDSPHSAHILPEQPHVLVVHSAEAPLPAGAGQRLTAGRIFALLHHDGDLSAAARDLMLAESGSPEASEAARSLPNWAGTADESIALVTSLFDATPTLQHIRTAAHSRMLSETGVLLNVLALRACQIPTRRKIPAIVGTRADLNLVMGTVGQSGSGKSSSHGVAMELLEAQDADLIRALGSGQGLAEQYMGTVLDGEGKKARGAIEGLARFFLEDEIDAITSKGENASDAALGEIRKAYSGAHLGQSNATAERNRNIPAGTYRFVLVANIQPKRSFGLFTEKQIHAGTPQRFVLLPALTQTAEELEELALHPLEFPGPLQLPVTEFHDGDFEVSEEIAHEVRMTFARGRADLEGTLRSHRQLTKLKVAAVLADLHGETRISDQWWELGEQVMQISDAQIEVCRSALAQVRAAENRAVATAQFEVARTQEELADNELEQIRERVLKAVASGASTRAELNTRLSTSRRKRLQEALDSLVEDEQLTIEKTPTEGRPRIDYKLTAC